MQNKDFAIDELKSDNNMDMHLILIKSN